MQMRVCSAVLSIVLALTLIACGDVLAGTISAGLTSPGLDFDGSATATSPAMTVGTDKFTIEAWVRPRDITSTEYQEITRGPRGLNFPAFLLSFQANGTVLSFGLYTTSYAELDVPITASNYTDGNWHHIAAVYDGANKRIYVDGSQIGTDQPCTGNVVVADAVDIGHVDGVELFNGQIDELRFWNVARTQVEVTANSGKPLLGTESGLIRYFRFDETAGSDIVDTVARADGTLSGVTRGYFGAPVIDNTVRVHVGSDAVVKLTGFDASLATQDALTATITALSLQAGDKLYQYNSATGGRGAEITAGNTAVTDSGRRIVFARGMLGSSSFNYTISNGGVTSIAATVTSEPLNVQTITFSGISNKLPTDPAFQVGATASSGLPVTLQLVTGPGTFDNQNPGTVTLTGSGTIIMRATQIGDGSNAPATVDVGIRVGLAQTITFPQPVAFFGQAALSATASSGLPITYTVISGPGSLLGSQLIFAGTEPVVVRASQNGDTNYQPAADVEVTVTSDPTNGTAQVWRTDSGNQGNDYVGDKYYEPGTKCLAVDGAGYVYVTGSAENAASYLTVKYKPDGTIEWAKTYKPTNDFTGSQVLRLDSAGNVYVTGYVGVGHGVFETHTLKYDVNGNVIWTATLGGNSNYPLSMILGSDGVYVSSVQENGVGFSTVKYSLDVDPQNAGKPLQLWKGDFAPGAGSGNPYAMTLDAAGNPVVVGSGATPTTFVDGIIVKWDRNEDPAAPGSGKILYSSLESGAGMSFDTATGVASNTAGDAFVAMTIDSTIVVKKLTNDNTKTTFATYTLPVNATSAGAYDIAVDSSNNVFVTGYTYENGEGKFVTIKFDAQGTQFWAVSEPYGGDYAYGQAIAVDGAGNVYVGGFSDTTATNEDYVAFKYNAAGERVWRYVFTSTGNNDDECYAMVLDSSANVYLSGYSYNGTNQDDFTTIKLSQANATRVTSTAGATPATAGVGQSVSFSVAATNDDGVPVSVSWNFGDSTAAASGASVTHSYAAAGTYNVTVTLTAGDKVTTQTLSVTVVAPLVGTGNDSDGDGFSDAFETAAGSNPLNAADTPAGAAAAAPGALTVSKIGIKLSFAKAASDSLSLSGTVAVPAGFAVSGKTVAVDIGGAYKSFVLDAKGGAKTKTESFKVTVKATKGAVAAQTSKYMFKASKGSFAAALADENLTGAADAKKENRSVLVTLIFNGGILQKTQTVVYTAKTGKTGSAK